MSESAAIEAALVRAGRLVDERWGVVRHVVVHDVGPSDPAIFCATAQLASTRPFSDGIASRLNGGAGLDRATATMGALGEAIERYAIGLYRETELLRAPFADLAREAVDPRRLIFFADEQYAWPRFPYVRFDAGAPLSWVAGISLLDGTQRWVPASRVYTPYVAPAAGDRLLQSASTGAACHVDRDRAVLAALYECIERDAVMIAWLSRLALPRLDPATSASRSTRRLLERFAAQGLVALLLDATSDLGIPTVFCILYAPRGTTPSLAVGAATRATLGAAAEKALVESAHTLFWIHTRCRDRPLPAFREDYADVTSLDLHSLLYGHPRMRERVAFLCGEVPAAVRSAKAAARDEAAAAAGDSAAPAASRAVSGSAASGESASDELRRCIAVLRRHDLDAVAIDLTPPDVADLGFAVVRVVVADLHPLWGGHQLRCLGGRRLAQVPVRLGYLEAPRATHELNTDPHPMP